MEQNSVNNRVKGLKPFVKGESGNPNGRPKGRRNFSTIFYDALENLAKKNGMDATQLETEIVEKALLSARKGDARFYKDLMDRVHGTAVQNVDHKTNGKDIPTPIISLDALPRNNSTEENSESH